jgi:hypothetical protein
MSLTALPVSVTDLTTLQQGIQFFTNNDTTEAAAINANWLGVNRRYRHRDVAQRQPLNVTGRDGGQRGRGKNHRCGRCEHAKYLGVSLDSIPTGSGRLRYRARAQPNAGFILAQPRPDRRPPVVFA